MTYKLVPGKIRPPPSLSPLFFFPVDFSGRISHATREFGGDFFNDATDFFFPNRISKLDDFENPEKPLK